MSIAKVFRSLQENIDNIRGGEKRVLSLELSDDGSLSCQATIKGPCNTPYEGYSFEVVFECDKDWPNSRPLIRFETPLYHCNAYNEKEKSNPKGKLCYLTEAVLFPLEYLLHMTFGIMEDPNAAGPANHAAADLYINNRSEHDRIAREWTVKYATKLVDS